MEDEKNMKIVNEQEAVKKALSEYQQIQQNAQNKKQAQVKSLKEKLHE